MNSEFRYKFLAALFIAVAAYFSDGHFHADEHHQIMEFAATKLGTNEVENMAWEYEARMRPSVQPSIIVLVHKVLRPLGLEDPFRVMRILRLLSGLLSLWAMIALFNSLRDRFENQTVRHWFAALSLLLWVLIYQSVRFSAESISASLLVLGLTHFLNHRNGSIKDHLIIGLWMGAAFMFRFQSGFFILGYLAYVLLKEKIGATRLAAYAAGGITMSALGVLIDRAFYGEWVLAAYNYFEQNILLDKASGFGVEPWWYYLSASIELGVPPFSLFFVLSVIIGVFLFRQNVVTWTLIPYVLIHFLIGHKEVRFFFPIVVFLPYLMVRSVQFLRENWNPNLLNKKWLRYTAKAFWVWNILLLVFISLRPADHDVGKWETVYDRYKEPITIYYDEYSPYGPVLQHNYFKPIGVSIQKIESWEDLYGIETPALFFTRNKAVLNSKVVKGKLVYSTFPEWVRNFNFNGWLDRTKQEYLIEL